MFKHNETDGLLLMHQSHLWFPEFSTEQRGRWVKAKQYVAGRFAMPIGEKAVDHTPPDFLRALPRPQKLHVEGSNYVRELRRLIESKLA
jgi:hypothetical protein